MTKIMNYISEKLNSIGMYRTVTLALIFLATVSHVLGFLGILPYTLLEQFISISLAVSTAVFLSFTIGRVFKIPVNIESAVITALIIFFIILPAELASLSDSWVIVLVTTLAVVSKFTIATRKQHLINPAAAGLVGLTLFYVLLPDFGHFESSWWIGTPQMFVPLMLAGVAVLLKVKKWTPVISFLFVGFFVFLFEEWKFGGDLLSGSVRYWLSGPSLFLAFFMLTEPFTMPPTKRKQLWYGALVGLLSQTTIFSAFFRMVPELALIFGNIFSYPSNLRQKLYLEFVSAKEIAKNTLEFSFKKPNGVNFSAGQYLEWMLPHKNSDNRGTRRYFTVVSAPSDVFLKVSIRTGENMSTFKSNFSQLKPGDIVIASQLAGDFVLPKDLNKKIAMIAGGIGITPFVSQIKELEYQDQKRDVILYSCNNTLLESAYREDIKEIAKKLPIKFVEVLAREQVAGTEFGFLSKEIILKTCPDYKERTWYISGPPAMVSAYVRMLSKIGISSKQIKTDYFSGLV